MSHEGSSAALVPALARSAGYLLWRAAARVDQALAADLPAGFDIHAYAALVALDDRLTLSQQELADRIGVSRTTMVRVAAGLTRAALVRRARNPDDRRSYALSRTAAGARAADAWREHAGALEARLVAGFSVAETVELQALLEHLAVEGLHDLTPSALRRSIGFLVTQVHARAHRDFAELLEPYGIAPRDFGSMTGLRSTGPVPQSELARMLGVSGPTVVQIVDELEAKGFLERRRDESDRRHQLVDLTPAGRTTLQRASRMVDGRAPGRLGTLSDREAERLAELLARFVTAP